VAEGRRDTIFTPPSFLVPRARSRRSDVELGALSSEDPCYGRKRPLGHCKNCPKGEAGGNPALVRNRERLTIEWVVQPGYLEGSRVPTCRDTWTGARYDPVYTEFSGLQSGKRARMHTALTVMADLHDEELLPEVLTLGRL
jgi:hypothetical protein